MKVVQSNGAQVEYAHKKHFLHISSKVYENCEVFSGENCCWAILDSFILLKYSKVTRYILYTNACTIVKHLAAGGLYSCL